MDESSLQISVMQTDDIAEVMRIEQASYVLPWSEQIVRDCLKVGYHGLVLKQNDVMLAYVFVSCAAGEAHILNICVHPDHRRQGYAKALLHQSIATVIVKGAGVIFLEVRESNHSAIELYESIGFVEIGRRADYYRRRPKSKSSSVASRHEDALIMSRDLSLVGDEMQ